MKHLQSRIRFLLVRARIVPVKLYAGDVSHLDLHPGVLGLSLTKRDWNHIQCDITSSLPFVTSSVDFFQAEDVFEHIEFSELGEVVAEIFRVLKPGGLFRLSVPDYRSPILRRRVILNDYGEPVFDPGGGGYLEDGKVAGGGHLWFPTLEQVEQLFVAVPFRRVEFLHYYDSKGEAHINPVDYRLGHVLRSPDHDARVASPRLPLSIIVDAWK